MSSPASAPDITKIVVDRLDKAEIKEIAVVDDVFEGPLLRDVAKSAEEFMTSLEKEGALEVFDKFVKDCSLPACKNAGDLTTELVEALWSRKQASELPAEFSTSCTKLFDEFTTRRDKVLTLVKHLEALPAGKHERRVIQLRSDDFPDDSVGLVFLDYYLSEGADGAVVKKSEEFAKKLSQRQSKRPFLVLMSDRQVTEHDHERFRDLTLQLGGTFTFLAKLDAQDEQTFLFKFAMWGIGHAAHTRIQQFIESVHSAVDDTADQFKQTIRRLNVQDFAFLQRVCLDPDGQPLGDYLLELFAGVFSYQFRDHERVQAARKKLDSMRFPEHLPFDRRVSEGLAQMYRLALTDPGVGPVEAHAFDATHDVQTVAATSEATSTPPQEKSEGASSHEEPAPQAADAAEPKKQELAQIGPAQPQSSQENTPTSEDEKSESLEIQNSPKLHLAFGDIFAKPDEDAKLLLLITPSCNLQFSFPPAKRAYDPLLPIYLMPGDLKQLHGAASPDAARTELFVHKNTPYRIEWDFKHVDSVRLGDFQGFLDKGYQRIARLALPYALALQRTWTSHLDRVGLPVPPPLFDFFELRVYAADLAKEWQFLGSPIVNGGGFLWRRGKDDKPEQTFVMTRQGVDGLSDAMNWAVEHITKLIEAIPADQTGRDKKIERLRGKIKKLEDAQRDVAWKVSLLEKDLPLPAAGGTLLTEIFHFCFDPLRSGLPDKKTGDGAMLLIDIRRTEQTA